MTKTIPDWASDPFSHFVDDAKELFELLNLTKYAIYMATKLPNLCKCWIDSERDKKMLDDMEQKAPFAQKIIDNKFPMIWSQATITLWTLIESTVRRFFANWLRNNSDALKIDELKKIKIPLGEY
jgi:hypothetical protein